MKHRVVITGMGAVTPIGNDVISFWENIKKGCCGIDFIKSFDTSDFKVKIAAEAGDIDKKGILDFKEAKRMDRFTQMAMIAADEAINDSGLKADCHPAGNKNWGVILGTGIGGFSTVEKENEKIIKKGPKRVSPFFIPMMISNMAAGNVAIYANAKGPNLNTVTACASGTSAIGEAFETIKRGAADIMIAGGTEAAITPSALAGFGNMKALSTRNDDPQAASRPFDKDRDGFVMGEGSGVIILEELEAAEARGADIIAEIVGYGASGDAYHITSPAPEGEGASRAMQAAIDRAEMDSDEVDYINAHGTSTPLNDKYESTAIKNVFGDHAYELTVSSSKSMTGHLLGAAGGVEAIITALAVKNDIVPPTMNFNQGGEGCDLNYQPNQVGEKTINAALSNSFGFGGQNACIMIKKYK